MCRLLRGIGGSHYTPQCDVTLTLIQPGTTPQCKGRTRNCCHHWVHVVLVPAWGRVGPEQMGRLDRDA